MLSLTAGCATTGTPGLVRQVVQGNCYSDAQLATLTRAQKLRALHDLEAAGKKCAGK